MRLWHATLDFLMGIHSGLPVCCVFQFTVDAFLDTNPVQERWRGLEEVKAEIQHLNYVPCTRCRYEIVVGKREPADPHSCRRRDGFMCNFLYRLVGIE